jgi:glycosyltransferase involved in cell wall biosynthesis
MVNAFSRTGKEKVWLGLRNYTDVEETTKVKLFIKLADLIICCSKDIEKELKNKFKFNKTSVLYNLYDVEAIRKEADNKQPEVPFQEHGLRYLVSMGRDDDMKGFWHMLKVFSLVHQNIPESRLILMGAGTFAKYRKLAEELNLTEAIYFAGMQKEPYPYLKMGEIYLLTSGNEGFPNALVEGMALSLAPVSVNCKTGPAEILMKNGDTELAERMFSEKISKGENPVLYTDYGILLPVMDKECNLNPQEISDEERRMADVVVHLMNDSEKLKFYQKAAAERAHLFTYESYVNQFIRLANEALGNRNASDGGQIG